ncbi:MAG: hypothetical protein QHI48_02695 [Bacteroidota bacterium]|nr:hypothetical protein [Bacteroidota bacterium]
MTYAVGYPCVRPFLDALASALPPSEGRIHTDTEENVGWRLLEQQCETAVVPPSVPAWKHGELSLVPGGAVSAVGPTNDIVLFFSPGLMTIRHIGTRSPEVYEILLAEVVLREKYRMTPTFHRWDGTVEEGLRRYDAVLLLDEDIPHGRVAPFHTLDLVDEWFDMTQLPFIRTVTAGWTHLLTKPFCDAVATAASAVDARLLSDLEERLVRQGTTSGCESVPGHYRCILDADVIEGLDVFFRFCFYHGLRRDIPSFHVWSEEERGTPGKPLDHGSPNG